MTFHLVTAKYDSLITFKTYINPGKGVPGQGCSPSQALFDWLKNLKSFLDLYRAEEVSLARFAELLGVSLEEAKDIILAENLSLNLGCDSLEELESDINNA